MTDTPTETTDYLKYRGKCLEMSEAIVKENPSLVLVRGYYLEAGSSHQHWWVKDLDGKIIDPTKDQFQSRGLGLYIEHNGIVECINCGREGKEDGGFIFEGRYVVCRGCRLDFMGVKADMSIRQNKD